MPSAEVFTSIFSPVLLEVVVKFRFETFALLTVVVWLGGLNVKPDLVGVTVYEPLFKFTNE